MELILVIILIFIFVKSLKNIIYAQSFNKIARMNETTLDNVIIYNFLAEYQLSEAETEIKNSTILKLHTLSIFLNALSGATSLTALLFFTGVLSL
jgi:hypothetical protein